METVSVYAARRAALADWLGKNGLAAALFLDNERARDPAVRYFTGHPADAVFALAADGRSALSPWDEHLAALAADADIVVPYTAFDREPVPAACAMFKHLRVPQGARVEIPPSVSYPDFLKYVDALQDFEVICREAGGAHEKARDMRAVKDSAELEHIRAACRITNELIALIEERARNGAIAAEIDAALLIERECRLRGADGTGFATLAAGPERSFGIHCFPPCTAAAFPAPGMSILDFGVVYRGYTSDVTLTITKGRLTDAQEAQLALVQKAYDAALPLYKPGAAAADAARKVKAVFGAAKRELPHGLGHGIGLEIHERPFVRVSAGAEAIFRAGMTVTLEPGLYSAELGGARLENSILITPDGNETLTAARILRL